MKNTVLTGGGTGITIGAAAAPNLAIWDTTDAGYVTYLGQINENAYLGNAANGFMSFGTNNTERMRLDSSGNLGIGTASPSAKLSISSGNIFVDNANGSVIIRNADVTNQQQIRLRMASNDGVLDVTRAGGTAPNLIFGTEGTEKMRLDSSGNLGLGVTPSAWGTGKAFELAAKGNALWGGSGYTSLLQNVYYDGAYRYGTTAGATRLDLEVGAFKFFTAASGTAGNAISFTQAMTLDASGNLLVGTTSASGLTSAGRIVGLFNGSSSSIIGLQYGGSNSYYLQADSTAAYLWNSANTPTVFATNNTERARITSGGEFLVGTTSASMSGATRTVAISSSGFAAAITTTSSTAGDEVLCLQQSATSGDNAFIVFKTEGSTGTARGSIIYNRGAGQVSYNITSDARLKENISDSADAGGKIDAMQVRQFDWKETGNHLDYGFVAQELHDVAPHAVSKPEDDDKMWSVDYSKLVPMLIKEVQSLRKRVAELEAK